MQKKILSTMVAALSAVAVSGSAWATNGMNLEGYGPIATAMGGAAEAYDTGNSAVMNNPATLGLMEEGTARLGVGIRMLGPDITSGVPAYGISSDSDGTSYYMPSISYIRKDGKLSWGAAVLAQGGMGTEYGDHSQLFAGGMSMMGSMTPLSGREVRSEVSVGRLMFPVAFNVNDKLNVGASLDVVWGGMDLQMDMDGAGFAGLTQGMGGSATGTMVQGLGMAMQGGMISDVNWARYDFSNSSDYSGDARGYGLGGKIGATYQVNDKVRVGGSYHTKTNMSDFNTDDATLSMNAVMGGQAMTVDITGELDVVDFQWPAMAAIGGSFQATDRLMLAADVKWIDWSGVMDTFDISFKADRQQANPAAQGFAGSTLKSSLDQKWDDQIVWSLGAAYKVNDKLTVRGGANISKNPISDRYVNPLFPATIEEQYTAGFSYGFDSENMMAFSLTYAPEVSVRTPSGLTIDHSQLNWGLAYVHTFR